MGLAGLVQIEARSSCRAGGGLGGGEGEGGLNSMKSEKCGAFWKWSATRGLWASQVLPDVGGRGQWMGGWGQTTRGEGPSAMKPFFFFVCFLFKRWEAASQMYLLFARVDVFSPPPLPSLLLLVFVSVSMYSVCARHSVLPPSSSSSLRL